MDSRPSKKTNNLENRSSVESRKIWDIQQKQPSIIDTGDITSLDSRFVNDHPNGQILTLRDNDGVLVDVRLSDGKIYKANSTYSEI